MKRKISQGLVGILAIMSFSISACQQHHEEHTEGESHTIVATSPEVKEVTLTQPYVCQIHSRRHINVCALVGGYLQEIKIAEGQEVEQGAVMFKILPTLYNAKNEAEQAEAKLAKLELTFAQGLSRDQVISANEVSLYEAKLARANAKANLAQAELNFTDVRAPFSGIADRLYQMQGSLIKEGETLTTLSDNSVMWVYFNVPEARYLDYKARQGASKGNAQHLKLPDSQIELRLANGSIFEYGAGDTVTVEGKFNNQTGNIPFRADFQNPKGLLRHGQTGTVLIHQKVKDALVIPQRATFEILAKRYVYVIDKDNVVHQREIVIQNELNDLYVIKSGLTPDEKFVLEGVRQVHDGETTQYEFKKPEEAIANLERHAE